VISTQEAYFAEFFGRGGTIWPTRRL